MQRDVADLVERARNDALAVSEQHAAFAELVRRFEESAFGWSLRRLDDAEEARDATQEAFITAWLKLRQLRDPAAFGAWLKRLVSTQCNRRIRNARREEPASEREVATQADSEHREKRRFVARAISKLSEAEHRVVVLFYFLGRTLDEIAGILGVPRGTVGKRLHAARITIRRNIPRGVRAEFLQTQRKVSEAMFDEYVGEYRFAERPDLVVRIEREDGLLVSYAGGQRSVLASLRDGALITTAYDGEGRFQRDRDGRVVQFIYYEFGARLGVATKCP